MKIIYIADMRLPTEKAHGLQIMKTCGALAKAGHEVTLMIPSWNKESEEAAFDYYSTVRSFSIKKIAGLNILTLGKLGFALRSLYFARSAARALKRENYDVVYTRDEAVVYYLSAKKVFYEIHDVRKSYFQKRVLDRATGIIAISNGLKDYCISQGISPSKIIVAPDAVDVEMFAVKESRAECRRKLDLPLNKKIVLYSGHLYSWKGADVLAAAAEKLDRNISVIFVGGTSWDADSFQRKFGMNKSKGAQIYILGQKPHELIPYYLKAADVLVIPNSAKQDISRLYTSPIKLFEYMASGTPVVASGIPSLREILNDSNAVFAAPDDPVSLAKSIRFVLDNPAETDILSHQALLDVRKHTWDDRAERILGMIESI